MPSKQLLFAARARGEMLKGIDILADAVRTTLGPRGRSVMIARPFGAPVVTRDGATIAREMTLVDQFQDLGAQMVKEVAAHTSDMAGDGTTTAIVLAQAVFREGLKAVAAGMDPMDLRRGLDRSAAAAMKALKRMSVSCKDTKVIAQVGAISANSDDSIGLTLANAIAAVGKEGVITVQEGRGVDDTLRVVEGMQFDRGYLSPYFVSDAETMSAILERPGILIYDKKIQNGRDLVPLLEAASQSGKTLMVIAEDLSGGALALLVINTLRGIVRSAAVRGPGFGDQRRELLEDIAIVTGGKVISREVGLTLENATLEDLGTASSVRISKDTTTIVDGGGSKAAIERRVAQLRGQIEEATSDYERERLDERIARLSGGVAIIEVGAMSEVALKERKARFNDALHATRAAVQEGILPGGGVALIRAREAIRATPAESVDQAAGIRVLLRAVEEPLRQIVRNGGGDDSVVLNTVLAGTGNFGFNAATEQFGDLVEMGVIDPAKVTRLALQNAVSIAGQLFATQAAVASLRGTKPRIT